MTQFAVPLRVSSQLRSELEHKEGEMRGWRLTLIVTVGLNGWTHSAAADTPQSPAPQPTLNLGLRNMTTLSPAVLAEARGMLTQTVSADEATRLHISVHFIVEARVPRDVVERAKPETARIYQHIGIDVVFVDEPSAVTITARVIETPVKKARGASMGIALRSGCQIGRLVYAFYGSVDAYARQHAIPVAQVLGHVVAHELGHLLLPNGSHAQSGIMTAAWDRKQIDQIDKGWLSFTREQAEAIRARVSALIPTSPQSLIPNHASPSCIAN